MKSTTSTLPGPRRLLLAAAAPLYLATAVIADEHITISMDGTSTSFVQPTNTGNDNSAEQFTISLDGTSTSYVQPTNTVSSATGTAGSGTAGGAPAATSSSAAASVGRGGLGAGIFGLTVVTGLVGGAAIMVAAAF